MGINPKDKELMQQQPMRLVPVAEYSKPGILSGFILPDGTMLMNVNPNVSGAVLGLYERQLNAQRFSMKGTWTFVPDPETVVLYNRLPKKQS